MKLNQINVLREQGYKVRVTHYRYAFRDDGRGSNVSKGLMSRRVLDMHNNSSLAHIPYIILPCGGRVTCDIETPDGRKAYGESNCSKLDNFKRKIGTAMAFGRAMKQIRSQPPRVPVVF